jgi:hypothetical protein
MEYDDRPERLLAFVQGKVKIPEGVDCVCFRPPVTTGLL